MTIERFHRDEGNHHYWCALAASLVAECGVDDALETSRRRGWNGVWSVLIAQRSAAVNDAVPGEAGQARHTEAATNDRIRSSN